MYAASGEQFIVSVWRECDGYSVHVNVGFGDGETSEHYETEAEAERAAQQLVEALRNLWPPPLEDDDDA